MPYAQFDEIENVLVSVDLLATLAPLVKKRRNQSYWKWLVIAAHDALQGALVCATVDSTGTSILSKKSAERMLQWLEDHSKEYPAEYMADFNTLLKRSALGMPQEDSADIAMLHKLRNVSLISHQRVGASIWRGFPG